MVKKLMVLMAMVLVVGLFASMVSADSHGDIRKLWGEGDEGVIDYYAGYTYAGTVTGGDCIKMPLQLKFALDGKTFDFKFGKYDTATAGLRSDFDKHQGNNVGNPHTDGMREVDGRITSTSIGKVREFLGESSQSSVILYVQGGFYENSEHIAKGNFGVWDWSDGWKSCEGKFSIRRQ